MSNAEIMPSVYKRMLELSSNETLMNNVFYDNPTSDEMLSSSLSIAPFALFTSNFWIQTTFSMHWSNTSAEVRNFIAHHADIGNETDGVLNPVEDVSVNAVWTAAVLNSFVGVMMLLLYEGLRRIMPSVYGGLLQNFDDSTPSKSSWSPLWIIHVLKIPWSEVRVKVGLDAYMFLRYIRMAMRITSISAFWGIVILWPTYYSGSGQAKGWYTYSMANIEQSDWRMWIPFCFTYLMTAYVLWSLKEEYKHYLSQRMDFLSGKCDIQDVHPQQRYSIMVDSIPKELRSDQALFDYFSSLFPNRVHSARVVLNLPDLEAISRKRVRITRRLEKSIAVLEATGMRPRHIIGRPRWLCMGIESELSRKLSDINCSAEDEGVWNKFSDDIPKRGCLADSIDYYTRELANINECVEEEQKRKITMAELGNIDVLASRWIESQEERVRGSTAAKNKQLSSPQRSNASIPQDAAINNSPTTQYGSHYLPNKVTDDDDPKQWRLLDDSFFLDGSLLWEGEELAVREDDDPTKSRIRRMADKFGLDFVSDGIKISLKRLSLHFEDSVGTAMSATGFVTFYDLASVACAVGTRLSAFPETLSCKVAPEPRDIIWANAHIDRRICSSRENIANVLLFLGAILWSVPLAAIQAFATADAVAQIPGFAWILANPEIASFVNGYLPVVALLGLLLILPIIFEAVAEKYETRKTQSDIQKSVLQRYFYYQLANIYISITAGSIWRSIYDIIDKPYNCLVILGKALPTVAGYFISLLLTKILAGLPMVLLRFGALARMVLLKSLFSEARMTQRELDEVYKDQPLLYGCEYPTQLLVIMICFTYASISPIILPFGAVYFFGALLVYKKQAVFVYKPTYESGGSLFPAVCDRTIVGLILSQLTFLGYCIIRKGRTQPILLMPLPVMTYYAMRHFRRHYGTPGKALSLERARQIDHHPPSDTSKFDRDAYRQPVLAEGTTSPMPYRRGMSSSNDYRESAYATEDSSTILGGSILDRHERSDLPNHQQPEIDSPIKQEEVPLVSSFSSQVGEVSTLPPSSSQVEHAVALVWAEKFPSYEQDLHGTSANSSSDMWYSADSD